MSINSAEQGLPAMAGRVLLIDNSTKHTERVRDLVSRTRLEVYTSGSAQDAIRQMLVHTFDVIALHTAVEGAVPLCTFLLDLRHARNTLLLLYPVPTAEARAYYYRRGFDLCLPEDDPVECAAAIEALLRHPWAGAWDAGQRPPALVVHRDLVIDPLRRRVTMRGRDIDLTPAEYRLLYFLASNPGIVFSKDYLYARVWGEDRAYGAGSVVNFICSLRKKLGLTARDPEYIRTVSHAGYCFGNTLLPSSSGFITPCTVEKVPFSRGFSNFLDSIVCPPVPSGSGQKL